MTPERSMFLGWITLLCGMGEDTIKGKDEPSLVSWQRGPQWVKKDSYLGYKPAPHLLLGSPPVEEWDIWSPLGPYQFLPATF